jgi:hypothetical protein
MTDLFTASSKNCSGSCGSEAAAQGFETVAGPGRSDDLRACVEPRGWIRAVTHIDGLLRRAKIDAAPCVGGREHVGGLDPPIAR